MVTMQRLKSTVTGESAETFILVWERKHLAAELVDVGVNKDELVGGLE